MSGGSRGIGLAIALRAARDGANIALLAKTAEPHPRLEGTVFTAAEAIEAAGGQALAIVGDVRDDDTRRRRRRADRRALRRDRHRRQQRQRDRRQPQRDDRDEALRPHAGRQHARHVPALTHVRPAPRAAANPHVLTLSPPLSLDPKWYARHLAYTLAKFGMSMCTLGMAAEYADAGIAFNSLWPRTLIATAAVQNLLGGDAAMARSRRPEIVADAAHHILTRPARTTTGNFFIDDEVLAEAGVTTSARTPTWRTPTCRSTSSSTS